MMKQFVTKLTSTEATKMIILVRTDIGMGRGKIASQVAHAAVSLYDRSLQTKNPYLKMWLNTGQPKIILKVDEDCSETLTRVYETALINSLMVCKIYDAGRTQVDRGTLTAVGIGPNRNEDIDKITNNFKLL